MEWIWFAAGWLACALYTLRRRRLGRRSYERVRRRLVKIGWSKADAAKGATVWFNVGWALAGRGRYKRS